jgi:hypothetical protein
MKKISLLGKEIEDKVDTPFSRGGADVLIECFETIYDEQNHEVLELFSGLFSALETSNILPPPKMDVAETAAAACKEGFTLNVFLDKVKDIGYKLSDAFTMGIDDIKFMCEKHRVGAPDGYIQKR